LDVGPRCKKGHSDQQSSYEAPAEEKENSVTRRVIKDAEARSFMVVDEQWRLATRFTLCNNGIQW